MRRSASRKPWQAALLSLLQPGLGQIYNGQAKKGLLCLGLSWVTILVSLAILYELPLPPFNIALPLVLLLALMLSLLVDAMRTAQRQSDRFQLRWYNQWYWGFVPQANILGVAQRIYWSWDHEVKQVRWERIGREIR